MFVHFYTERTLFGGLKFSLGAEPLTPQPMCLSMSLRLANSVLMPAIYMRLQDWSAGGLLLYSG